MKLITLILVTVCVTSLAYAASVPIFNPPILTFPDKPLSVVPEGCEQRVIDGQIQLWCQKGASK